MKTTAVYDAFWHFAAERQSIYHKRVKGEPRPWTTDEVLGEYRFTNAYRAADRVSQYLIKEVIYGEDRDQSPDEVFFRTILFKLFNKVDTWESIEAGLADRLCIYDLLRGHVAHVLELLVENGVAVYNSAYMTPSPPESLAQKKYWAHVVVLNAMLDNKVPEQLLEAQTMAEAFKILRSYPMIGDFMGYQLVTDLNYSEAFNWSETEFTIPGPGAKDGIAKCFSDIGRASESDIIQMVTRLQEVEFAHRGLVFDDLFGRPLQYIDVQNLFCEISKYSRITHPHIKGKSNRTNIKAKHTGERAIPRPWFPPKWGINEKIDLVIPYEFVNA